MPISQDIRDRYKKRLESYFKKVDDLSKTEIDKSIQYLEGMGKKIRGEMSKSTSFRADHLKKLKEDVGNHITEFKDMMVKSVQKTQGKSYNDGTKSTDYLGDAFKIDLKLPAVSLEQLLLAQNFTEDLAVQLSDEVRRKVSRAINEVALGIKTPIEAMGEIEKWVSPVKTPKGFVGSAYRSEMIVRTAVNRAFDMGARARADQVEETQPGLQKWWLTAGDERVRPTHFEAGIRYSEDKPIDLNAPFHVGGSRLMYPSDPSGAPEEVINCRCRAIYVHPKWVSELDRKEKAKKKAS